MKINEYAKKIYYQYILKKREAKFLELEEILSEVHRDNREIYKKMTISEKKKYTSAYSRVKRELQEIENIKNGKLIDHTSITIM